MIHEGADIIDIGAESSKPGSEPYQEVQIKNRTCSRGHKRDFRYTAIN